MDRRNASRVTIGILLIAMGLLLFGEQIHVIPAWSFGRLWPLILIAFGISQMLTIGSDGRRGNGSMMILCGAIFLLHTHGVLTLGQSWPLFVVAWGVSMLTDAPRGCARRPEDGPSGL